MNDTTKVEWRSHPPNRDACAVTDDPEQLMRDFPPEAYPWVRATESTYPRLMTGEAYFATIKTLVECHPEDLVNILSSVIGDRADITNPSDPRRKYDEGWLIVPGCPGEADCPDHTHEPGHAMVPDRKFTIQIDQVEIPPQA